MSAPAEDPNKEKSAADALGGGEEGIELTPAQKAAQEKAEKERKIKEKTRTAVSDTIDDIMEGVAEIYRGVNYVISEVQKCVSGTVYPVKEFFVGDKHERFRAEADNGVIDEATFEMA
ncbi:unnamed protein product [Amoebophrya sp. A120]|nr:unnamed protein product [Amoebophrya sp. A120]|eukprot:GSA120T00007981001.1